MMMAGSRVGRPPCPSEASGRCQGTPAGTGILRLETGGRKRPVSRTETQIQRRPGAESSFGIASFEISDFSVGRSCGALQVNAKAPFKILQGTLEIT